MTPATFFGKLKAGAFYNWRTYKVLPSVCAAQAALESGWGESTLTKNANNLFGMKGSYNGASVNMRTAEYNASGQRYYINANFRKYPNWNASVIDYATNLRKSGYYPVSAFATTNYVTQIRLIGAVYATSPSYATDVIKMIQTYGLDKWDQEALAGGTGGTFDPSEISASGGASDGSSQYKTFQEDYIKENSTTRPKLKLNGVKGVVMHEIVSGATAKAFRNTLNSGNQGKKMGYHIIVDGSSAIGVVPLNEGVYHADRTGQRFVTGLGNANNATISIGFIRSGASASTNTLKNLALAVGEVARIYKLPIDNIWGGFLVDGTLEPEIWAYDRIAYSAFLAVVEAVKISGANVITNPDFGDSSSSSGSNTGLIPGGDGIIQKLVKEGLYWEGKLKYSMDLTLRHHIYPGGYADCSTFTQYVFKKATGRDIGPNTWAQIAQGKSVSISSMRAGDLVFWERTYDAPPPTHVGIVISGTGPTAKVVHCGTAGKYGGVAVIRANDISGLYRARRLFSDEDYNTSQNISTATKPTISAFGSYAVGILAPTNAYSQDSGGYSVKRMVPGEVYKVTEVGVNSLKVSTKTGGSSSMMRAMTRMMTTNIETSNEVWIPIHSTGIQIAELPTTDSSIGVANIKIPVKVLDGPSGNSQQVYDGGKNKTFGSGENTPIYSIENRFGSINPEETQWITLATAYCDTSVELETLVAEEVDFTKGQTIETTVVSRADSYTDEPFTIGGIVPKNGVVGFAHKDLLPIGSVVNIEVPTNPGLNRKVVILSNKIKTTDGNKIEVYFDNEKDKYNFGTRNALVSLDRQIRIPEDLRGFFNGAEDTVVDEEGNFFD